MAVAAKWIGRRQAKERLGGCRGRKWIGGGTRAKSTAAVAVAAADQTRLPVAARQTDSLSLNQPAGAKSAGRVSAADRPAS